MAHGSKALRILGISNNQSQSQYSKTARILGGRRRRPQSAVAQSAARIDAAAPTKL